MKKDRTGNFLKRNSEGGDKGMMEGICGVRK
jgi:hypothetical protein